jgi:hypothetical protein
MKRFSRSVALGLLAITGAGIFYTYITAEAQTTEPASAPATEAVQTGPAINVQRRYVPAASSAGISATTCREGDLVAAWAAVPAPDYTRWNEPFKIHDPIPGIKSDPWNQSPGCYLDTSKAGTYEIKKNGVDCGTLTILPALPVKTVKAATTAELEAALPKADLESLTEIRLAPGVYEPAGPDAPKWNGNSIKGHVKLVADGNVTIRSKTPVNSAAFNMVKGDIYVEGCELDGNLFSTSTTSRVTLKKCEIRTQIFHVAGIDGGNGGLCNVVFDRCKIVDGGGLFVGTPFFIDNCEFTGTKIYPHQVLANGNGAIHNSTFRKTARGVVVWTTTSMMVDNNYFDAVEGEGNGCENFLVEGDAAGLCLNRNLFTNSIGTSIQISANRPCKGNIIANNRMLGSPPFNILLYNQEAAGRIDDTAIFGNYGEGGAFLIAMPALNYATNPAPFGSVRNTRGGDNVFVNQRPAPSPTGQPRLEGGSFNSCPATYTDCVWAKIAHPRTGGQVHVVQTKRSAFYPEQVGVHCSLMIEGKRFTFVIKEMLDDRTVVVDGFPTANPGPVPAFSVPGPQPVYTAPRANNTVGVTIVRPFTKPAFISPGDAQVIVR